MTSATVSPTDEERLRPLYARVLRLRHVDPGGMLCFVFFEGTVALGLLLALAELVNWWGVLVLPLTVAAMVKVNDAIAASVVRTAARVPGQERERFRREIQPAVGRAGVPRRALADAGQTRRVPPPGSGVPGASDPPSGGSRSADRPPTGFIPVARPLTMTAVVRARLELGGRRRLRRDPAEANPTADDGRGRIASAEGATGPRSGLSQTRQGEPPPAVVAGRPRNRGRIRRLEQRPVRRWLSRLDPIDITRQSAKRRYE